MSFSIGILQPLHEARPVFAYSHLNGSSCSIFAFDQNRIKSQFFNNAGTKFSIQFDVFFFFFGTRKILQNKNTVFFTTSVGESTVNAKFYLNNFHFRAKKKQTAAHTMCTRTLNILTRNEQNFPTTATK